MHKLTKTAVLAVAAGCLFITACSSKNKKEEPLVSKPHRVALSKGSVQVYNFGNLKLHAYQTNDAMNDVSFLIETPQDIIAIEAPAFHSDFAVYGEYVKTLKKPLSAALLSYHPTGNEVYDNAKIYTTEATIKGMADASKKATVEGFIAAFGKDFDARIADFDEVLSNGAVVIDGVKFIITDEQDGFEIEIPAMRAVYIHVLSGDAHSIIPSADSIDPAIKKLEALKAKNYALILSSHHMPETPDAIDSKIEYLTKTKEIIAQSADGDIFVAKMKEAFPTLGGENYLMMTKGMLFPAK